ncbi:MAG TPA: glycosyltransferase family 4 protein [Acetobacteraceae bacterium]|jgi:glycosyltransferase involved in cell wall biosynthesis|nr:glycosyltransferase family 4 protein [Acetobacteraceae bacterium]
MRILYSHRIQSRDGMSVHVEELVTAFLQQGHEVLVVGPGFYEEARFGGESGAVALIRRLLPGALGELAEIAYNLPAYRRLRRAYDSFAPDFIYERYNLFFLAGALLSRQTGIPLYLEVNSPLAEERSRFGSLRLRGIARRLERFTWSSARRVLAVTGVLRDRIVAAGVPPSRIEIVPNGVVLRRFTTCPLPKQDGDVVLGFVGFVRSWHGLDLVIRGMATPTEGPRVTLRVVGDGPARAELEQLATTLGVADRIRFTGVVEHALVPDLVQEFDIALQPRVVAYASPLKIFDYMAAGRAIVAPDQPNIREILEHERTALLVDPADPDGVWRAVLRLARDPGLRGRLGAAARMELETREFTWLGNARRIVDWAAQDAGAAQASAALKAAQPRRRRLSRAE